MLSSLTALLQGARREGYAVVAPDFVNLAMARSCLRAAEQVRAPLILQYTPAFLPVAEVSEYGELIRLVRREAAAARVPVALHLDHGASLDEALTAMSIGYTSVMFDGSTLPHEENARITRAVVTQARRQGVCVEAEIGHVGSDGVYGGAEESSASGCLTDPGIAAWFAEQTGVDALAVAIGTVHGQYRGRPELDFARLDELRQAVAVPLVLHGCSGTGAENLRRAVRSGICKLNVYSDLVRVVREALAAELDQPRAGIPDLLRAADQAVASELTRYIHLSGSAGRCC